MFMHHRSDPCATIFYLREQSQLIQNHKTKAGKFNLVCDAANLIAHIYDAVESRFLPFDKPNLELKLNTRIWLGSMVRKYQTDNINFNVTAELADKYTLGISIYTGDDRQVSLHMGTGYNHDIFIETVLDYSIEDVINFIEWNNRIPLIHFESDDGNRVNLMML